MKWKRVLMSLSGVILTGVCVGLIKYSGLGTDPFNSLVVGLSVVTKIDYGVMYIIVNAALLVAVFFMNKKYIGIATVLNLFFVGVIADGTETLISGWLVMGSFWAQIGLLAFALVLACFAAALYMTADLGVSTYDAMAMFFNKKSKLQFRWCRIITDLVCVLSGFLMGATVGIGTVVTAFCMGPIVQLFNKYAAVPLLYGRKKADSGSVAVEVAPQEGNNDGGAASESKDKE